MELSVTVAIQVVIMFIIIIMGFIAKKVKMITKDGSKQMSDILLILVTPCVIIKSYQVAFRVDLATNLVIAFVAAAAMLIMAAIVSRLTFGRSDSPRAVIDEYCAGFSNCGFMGIPLLEATLGPLGVFYGSAFLALFNVLNWTHGVLLYMPDGEKKLSVKKIFLNPGIIGVAIGLTLFFLQIKLPDVIMTAVSYMAGLNTPLAMLLIGVFLADVDILKALKNPKLYLVSLMRLIVIPIITIVLLSFSFIPEEVAVAIVIPAACPCAAASALFAAKYDRDAGYASELVSINTIFSILTIPIIVMINSLMPTII